MGASPPLVAAEDGGAPGAASPDTSPAHPASPAAPASPASPEASPGEQQAAVPLGLGDDGRVAGLQGVAQGALPAPLPGLLLRCSVVASSTPTPKPTRSASCAIMM